MTKISLRSITNDNCNLPEQWRKRPFRAPLEDQVKWTVTLILVMVTLCNGPAWAQSTMERPSLAGSAAIGPWTASLGTLPPGMPGESTLPAEISPKISFFPAVAVPKPTSHAKKLWILSAVVLTTASLVDLSTSLGHNEANPALRGTGGQASVGRGVSIKLGLSGVTMLMQSLLTHHRPDLYRPCAVINAVGAGVFGAAALHNENTPH